jgi:dipeptidyl aminopeptidase/acylaminoacyl peptidase
LADDRSPITIEDLYQLGWIEEPRFNPDGQAIAFVHVTVDRAGNRYRRAIWLAPADGRPPWRLTAGTKSDTTPRWSPDGRRLAFVSNREGQKSQLYLIDIRGGEARRLTNMPQGASDPAWSSNGKRIAFLSMTNPAERDAEDRDEPQPEPADDWERQQAEARRAYEEQRRFDPRILSRLPYRSGTTFFDDRRNHIYIVGVPDGDEPPARPRRLTDGELHFGAPAWMPDGLSILSTSTRDPEADAMFTYFDLLRVPVPAEGRGEAQLLTETGFSYYDPHPSPDGSLIALRRRPDDRPFAAAARIALLPAEGGALRDLTADADLNVEQYRWLPNGQGLLYSAGWRGEQAVYQVALSHAASPTKDDRRSTIDQREKQSSTVDRRSSPPPPVFPTAGRLISDFDVGPDGSVAFVAGAADNPCDLYLLRPDGAEARLTTINARLLSQRRIAPLKEVLFAAPDGRQVQGWALYPPDFDPSKRYPLALHIHGGPHVMWGPGMRSMWHEWQVTAARGYVVFFCNPRGSEGYGEGWRDAIHAGWGVIDAPDFLAGVDAMIERGGVDPARIGVTGGSYGGYMTVWLIAHSDRFACAVSARGVYNLITEHGTSDAHELIEFEFDGYPWDMHEKLWQHSPIAHAHNITTPLRILHSELDYRVPISEAEQLFSILRRRKQVVEFVRYPREGHELTRSGEPRHRADHMERTLEWFDRYCQTENREPRTENR